MTPGRLTRAVLAVAAPLAAALAVGGCGDSTSAGSGLKLGGDGNPSITSDAPATGAHRGGTLVLLSKSSADTGDPQVNYSVQFPQLYPVTFDGLTTFAKEGPGLGERIVPDIATNVPTPTDHGLTWLFHIRHGIRFSDGERLVPADVKASFERMFKVKGPTAGTFYGEILGSGPCLKAPAGCRLDRGIVVDARRWTVTFHLGHADPEFLQQLSVWFAAILPASAPTKDIGTDVRALPSTGPYMWTEYQPTKDVILKRNPYFHQWSAQAQPDGFVDEIEIKYGLEPTDEVTEVANDEADYLFDPVPADQLYQVSTEQPAQVHVNQQAAVWYWSLNTTIPPFDNRKARQAVNDAFDRNTAVLAYGGPKLAHATCQVLPPGYPGYRPYCPYGEPGGTPRHPWKGPDMARARRLVAESGTRGDTVDVVPTNTPMQEQMGQYMQTLLARLGYRPRLKPLDDGIQYSFVQNTKNHVGAALELWSQDYTAPSDFLHALLSCQAFTRDSDANPNIGGFCDRHVDAEMAQASRLQLAGRARAADARWAAVDHDVTDAAPWVSLFTPSVVDFVSRRLGGYNWSPTYLMLPSRVWVK